MEIYGVLLLIVHSRAHSINAGYEKIVINIFYFAINSNATYSNRVEKMSVFG